MEGEDLGVSKRGIAERWKEFKEKTVKKTIRCSLT